MKIIMKKLIMLIVAVLFLVGCFCLYSCSNIIDIDISSQSTQETTISTIDGTTTITEETSGNLVTASDTNSTTTSGTDDGWIPGFY